MMSYYNKNNLFPKLAYGDLSEVQALLKSGVNIDEHKNERGETALYNTLFTGYMDRAALLLKHNASPNIQDNSGQTILHLLVADNSIDKMKFLFENTTNIDLEIKSFSGHFPLYTSMLNENIDAMDLLLKKGADINSKDSFGGSALHGADVNSKNSSGASALHGAIYNNQLKAAELLLKHGADVNAKDNYGNTILHHTIGINNIEAAKLLIKYGADVNVKNNNNFTPLDSAILGQQKELAELFLKSGATIKIDNTMDFQILNKKLLDMNIDQELIFKSLLISNINDQTKFQLLSDFNFKADIHHKIIDNCFKDKLNNEITEQVFKNLILNYDKYKNNALFKDSSLIQKIQGLQNIYSNKKPLEYIAFEKLLSLHPSFKIKDHDIVLNNIKEDQETENKLNITYDMMNKLLNTMWGKPHHDLSETTWDNNNSQSVLSNLFETELSGDIS